MREVEGPHQAWEDHTEDPETALGDAQSEGGSPEPTEAEQVIMTLLMRLYDVQLSLLEHFDKATAEALWAEHDKGAIFNPKMFLLKMKDEDD